MPLFKRVRRLLGEGNRVVHECRHCGTTLEAAVDSCDTCGSDDVVRYVIE